MESRIDFPFIDSACGSGSLLKDLHNRQKSTHGLITTDLITTDLVRTIARLKREGYSHVSRWDIDSTETFPHSDNIRSKLWYDLLTIDTIHLSLPIKDVCIAPNHQLVIQYAKGKNSVLWRNEEGDIMRGFKATWDGTDKGIYLEISRIKKDFHRIGCIVQLHVPSVYGHGDNFMPLDYRVTDGVFEAVEEKLKEIGVSVDLKRAKVVRCDLNRNIALDQPFINYKVVWEQLHFPRTKRIVYKETGVMCFNKSQTVRFYDKLAEMEKGGFSTEGLPPTARLEWHIKGARRVREKLGIESLDDLLKHWEELPARYQKCKNTLFSHDLDVLRASQPREVCSGLSPTQKEIQNLLRWCRKKQVKFGSAEQLQLLMEREGLEAYGKHIKAMPNINPKYASTAIRRMRLALKKETARTDDNFVSRYEELKYKFNGNGFETFATALYLGSYLLTKTPIVSIPASNTSATRCYHFGSQRVNKSGRTGNGKRRYQCGNCKRTLRESPRPQAYTAQHKAEILQAYHEGTSLRGLTRKFGVSRQTVTSWLKNRNSYPNTR